MVPCEPIDTKFILGNNIILHVLILFVILCGLFKIIIAPLITKKINNEFIDIINSLINPEFIKSIIQNKNNKQLLTQQLSILLNINKSNPAQILILNQLVEYIIKTPPDQIKSYFQLLANNFANYETELRQKNNSDLYNKMIMIIIFGLIIAYIINIFPIIFGNKCTGIKHLSLELLAIFTCVGGIEYWFFQNIGKKYIPVGPSVITETLKQHLLSLINEPMGPKFVSTSESKK